MNKKMAIPKAAVDRIRELSAKGESYRGIAQIMKRQGVSLSPPTVARVARGEHDGVATRAPRKTPVRTPRMPK
jgi:intein-encoded DNA endonuclease-like protein